MKKDYTFYALFFVLMITFFSYYPCINNDFTTWDDPGYINKNLSLQNCSSVDFFYKNEFVMGNFHPLTMVTYAVEYFFVGNNPKLYHLDNYILHLLNTAFVFWFIYLLSGWQIAAFVAVLFGVHPMHVESVAWISERKDVLYSFFYLSSLIFYVYFLRNKKQLFYAATFLFFIFSLLSKGVAVTLPLTLLLIDYFYQKKLNWKIIYDKIPFFILSIVFGKIAIFAQHAAQVFYSSSNTIHKISKTNFIFFDKIFHFANLVFERICYASYGLLNYIFKLLLPVNLSCFYPYPKKVDGFLPVIFYLSPIILTGIIVLIFIKWRKNKVVVFGLLFFVANIFLLLQLMPIGSSVISDRYSYIPSIGLFFMIAYSIFYFSGYKIEEKKLVESTFYSQLFMKRKIIFALVLFSISVYAIAANQRSKIWKNSETLYTNVLKNYPESFYIQYKLGKIYFDDAEKYTQQNISDSSKIFYQKAIQYFSKSVQLNRNFTIGWQGLAIAHTKTGMINLAKTEIDSAINLSPNNPELYINRSNIYLMLNDTISSLRDEEKASKLGIIKLKIEN